MVLVTLNYKWSLTFRAKTHKHNVIPVMHFHWQATPLSPGLALATNLCPLLSFSSIPLHPSFQAPRSEGFYELCPLSTLSIFTLVSKRSHCVTASCSEIAPIPLSFFFTPSSTLSLFSLPVKRNIPSTIPELFPRSAVPVFFCSYSFSHFVLFFAIMLLMLLLSCFLSFFFFISSVFALSSLHIY